MREVQIFDFLKIMKKEYLEKLSNGQVYFSCCAKWRSAAKLYDNKGQGDKNEGVFAKYLRKNSRKPIQNYKKQFGKDLIVRTDGEYVLLSRKSSLYVPATCFYSIDSQSIINELPQNEEERISKIAESTQDNEFRVDNVPLVIPNKFSDDFHWEKDDVEAILIKSPKNFVKKLKDFGMFGNKITYIDMSKEYDIFAEKLYEKHYNLSLEAAKEKHIDIFFKDQKNYEHQYEYRIILPKKALKSAKKGYTIKLHGLKKYVYKKGNKEVAPKDIDFICNTKNLRIKLCLIMEKR